MIATVQPLCELILRLISGVLHMFNVRSKLIINVQVRHRKQTPKKTKSRENDKYYLIISIEILVLLGFVFMPHTVA